MKLFPSHGKIANCSKCFQEANVAWGKSIFEENYFRLQNNPCAWGSCNPVVLILGFSKDFNQVSNISKINFDDIPFMGMRTNLTNILRTLGIFSLTEDIADRIQPDEFDFAFASFIRCSLSKWDVRTARFLTPAEILTAAFLNESILKIIINCLGEFLSEFPPELKLIIMLGNDDAYIKYSFEAIRLIHPDAAYINSVAYTSRNIIWVHVIHPLYATQRHIINWYDGIEGYQAEKRELAKKAVYISGVLEALKK